MAEPSLPDQGETLLVVEDNPDLREYMFEALQSLGYRPIVAESGQEALTRLAEVPQIAAVVCDVVLPGPMSGFEFAREARRRRRELQFLFVSGHADAANAGDILRELEADFLPKPFRRNELGRFVQSALIRSRARVAREA
jgi:CheY-like chemotaxis protein